MGNIVGEQLANYVSSQIKIRQQKLGSSNRTTSELLQTNTRSAWIKLTSAVAVVDTEKFKFPADIGKTYSLFGGTAKDGKVLGGFAAYQDPQFNLEQGYRPAPGITGFQTKNKNRGSLRESTVNIKAFSKSQFELIDILYLRLGYSVFIEFGNSAYFDNTGTFVQAGATTSISNKIFESEYSGDPAKLLQAIETQRVKTAGNYDGIFGRITNFEWNFQPDGSYDITLTVMSYGDVVEALKANSEPDDGTENTDTAEENPVENRTNERLQDAETDRQVIQLFRNIDYIGRLFFDIQKDLDKNPGPGSENCRSLSTANAFRLKGRGYKKYDAIKVHNQEEDIDFYYIRFGAFLQYLWDRQMLYINNQGTNPLITVDTDPATNLIYKTPYTLSSNPTVCIVRTPISISTAEQDFSGDVYPDIPEEGKFQDPDRPDAGRLMNVYINLAYILRTGWDTRDSKNKVKYYDIIDKILQGIQSSLGGRNTLSGKVSEDLRFYIQDEHPIPSVQKDQVQNPEAVIKLYGITPGQAGTFVRDFGIKTAITNELANTITIGAQANGQVKGEDATAFSKWNQGLQDRILPIKTNRREETKEERDKRLTEEEQIQKRNRDIAVEYITFLKEQNEYKWNPEKADSFGSILTNYLSFSEGASAVVNKGSTGVLGFLPLDLNFTIDGLAGMKIYQSVAVDSTFLPTNYGETMQFIITGITHRIEGNTWLTSIETNMVPSTVIATPGNQNFDRVSVPAATSGGGGGQTAAPTGTYNTPAAQGTRVALRLRRKEEQFARGVSQPDGTGQTLGVLELILPDGSIKEYSSVELPWRGNQNSISCIPPGTYTFTKSKANNNPGVGTVLRLGSVPGRSGVLIHVGTIHKDTHGCILPGILKQRDSNNDSIPDNKTSKQAMTEILNALYPAGVPNNTTYTLEVYGVPGKEYVGDSPRITYPNPSEQPAQDSQVQSRQAYIQAAQQLKKVLELKDAYNNNRPLLQELKSAFGDDEVAAVNRIKALINQVKQLQEGKPVVWQNKLPLDKLSKQHKKLFLEQFNNLMSAVKRNFGVTTFKYPDPKDPTKYETAGLSINANF